MSTTIFKVQVEIPEELKNQQPPFKYKARHGTEIHFDRHFKGSYADKFYQRKSMGIIESIILATEELECNGTIAISIQDGLFEFDANFNVIDDSRKQFLEKAFGELTSEAKSLMKNYPAARHSCECAVNTTFVAES